MQISQKDFSLPASDAPGAFPEEDPVTPDPLHGELSGTAGQRLSGGPVDGCGSVDPDGIGKAPSMSLVAPKK